MSLGCDVIWHLVKMELQLRTALMLPVESSLVPGTTFHWSDGTKPVARDLVRHVFRGLVVGSQITITIGEQRCDVSLR